MTEEEAVDQAFRLCGERALQVDRVERASLDSDGRWHVTLVGYVDRAQMMLDGRDGKLLRGRFYRSEPPPSSPPPSFPYPGYPAQPQKLPPPSEPDEAE